MRPLPVSRHVGGSEFGIVDVRRGRLLDVVPGRANQAARSTWGLVSAGFNAPFMGFNIQVFKQYTCDGEGDGPHGSFVLRLQVRIDRNGVNFSWVGVLATGVTTTPSNRS